jgi:hypothetical protein
MKLKNLLEIEVIPDVEVTIDDLFASIDKAKKATPEAKEDLQELREMRDECLAIVKEIDDGNIDDDEVDELLEAFMELKTEEE